MFLVKRQPLCFDWKGEAQFVLQSLWFSDWSANTVNQNKSKFFPLYYFDILSAFTRFAVRQIIYNSEMLTGDQRVDCMPARRMRVEVHDEAGNRYAITFDGRVTRDHALRILDMVELLGGMPHVNSQAEWDPNATKIERVGFIIAKHFAGVWFSAKEIQSVYEAEFEEPVSLSSASTYLSRLAARGRLDRMRNSNKVKYKLVLSDLRPVYNLKSPR